MIIFDCGSGNTCKNNMETARQMVMAIANLRVPGAVVKWQLFTRAGMNIPLNPGLLVDIVHYANIMGVGSAVSVFDRESVDVAMRSGVGFVKIANQQASRDMLKFIPEEMPVVISTDDPDYKTDRKNANVIYCISEYPAKSEDYIKKFGDKLRQGISDHTTDWTLFNKYQPKVYECHFRLEDSTGLDAGKFARTPKQIQEIMAWNQ